MSAASARYMGKVAEVGCILCAAKGLGATPAEVHHLKEECGASQRQSDYLAVPLCTEHHRGASGFHGLGQKAFERTYKLSELDLLALTIQVLNR